MTTPSDCTTRSSSTGRLVLILLAIAFAANLAGTWCVPLFDRDETNYAEATREMVSQGDWLVPMFAGKPFLHKPPLYFWLQGVSFRVLGESEFAARLPSVIAGVLTTLATFGFGLTLFRSRKAAFWGAVMFTLCVESLMQGKAGTLDMTLTLTTTLAWWSAWELLAGSHEPRTADIAPKLVLSRPAWWMLFYISLGLSALAKGPVIILPIATMALFPLLIGQRSIRWFFPAIVGGVIGGGLVVLWAFGVSRTIGNSPTSELLRRLITAPAGSVVQGHGSSSLGGYLATLPYHFLVAIPFFLPWSFWLPWLARRLWQKANRNDANIYLLTGITLTFLVFTVGKTKLPHYTYPAFPLLALLLAGQWIAAGKVVTPLRRWAAGMLAANLTVGLLVAPFMGPYMQPARMWHEVAGRIRPETQVGQIMFEEPGTTWYFRSQLKPYPIWIRGGAEGAERLSSGKPWLILAPTAAANATTNPVFLSAHRFDSKGWGLVSKFRLNLTVFANDAAMIEQAGTSNEH